MVRTSIFQREVLDVLEQLERCCDRYALYKQDVLNTETVVDIMITDIKTNSDFSDITKIYDVAKFLQEKGLDFTITFDFINDIPIAYIDEDHPMLDYVQLGVIKGKSIEEIKGKIVGFICAISDKSLQNSDVLPELSSAMNSSLLIGSNFKISETVKNKYKEIEFVYKNDKGMLRFSKKEKWIDVGGSNTRTCRMVRYIVGLTHKSHLVVDVFRTISIEKDDKNSDLKKNTPRSYALKKDVISSTVTELQKAKFLAGHIMSPVYDDKKKTVVIKFK